MSVHPRRLYVVMYAVGGDWVRISKGYDYFELAARKRDILREQTKHVGGEYRVFAWVVDPEWVVA